MPYFQVNEKCNGCLSCVQNCPANALDSKDTADKRTLLHNMSICARCGNCWRICPQDAVEFQYILENKWDEIVTLDLIRCSVCNEPLYPVEFSETLKGKTGQKTEPLCPRHKKAFDSLGDAHYVQFRKGSKEVEKR